MSYILLKTTCEADLHMDDSFNELISKGGRVLDRRDVFDLMHGRSRMILDPRTPTRTGRSTLGFHRPGRHR